jgi:acetyl-CoA carboxylase carboxyltransferase component
MGMKDLADELEARWEKALAMGGAEAVAKQHGEGKLTVRERVDRLFDPRSFQEIGLLANHANITPAMRGRSSRPLWMADACSRSSPGWAKNLITCLARLGGASGGYRGQAAASAGGALDVDAADKAARFIMLCDAFHIPLAFLPDVPGFMVGSRVERQGIIRHGAKMLCGQRGHRAESNRGGAQGV